MLPIGTHELSHVQKQENRHEQEQERTRTEAVHKVLVAGSDTLSFIFQNVHKHPFLDMEKAVNRID